MAAPVEAGMDTPPTPAPATFNPHAMDAPPGPLPAALIPDTVRSVYRQTGSGLFGHILGMVVTTAIYWRHMPHPLLLGWGTAFLMIWFARILVMLGFERAKRRPHAIDHERWLLRWAIGAGFNAATWCLGAILLYDHGGPFERTALMLIIYSFAIGSVPFMAMQTRLFLVCMALYFGTMIGRAAFNGQPQDLQMAGIWFLLGVCTLSVAWAFRNVFAEMVKHKLQNQELAIQLRGETAAAESAQRLAETANRAKTQFFAAASHDLRQPLHAMGLFAEALRQRNKDEEVVHLVNSINSSVDALEGLFSELLDITKIDTGAVDIEPEHFSMQALFNRIRLHFEPTAFEKGLMLSFRGGQHHALADPVIVERILRNLVSNAIRYTEDGGVLVTCRVRNGRLSLQVWDSGIGITEKEQGRIFDEFYQTQSGRPLEPHHRKGLGLGLSIVKRLAELMHAPLTLRSRVGHGTVFTLALPIGRAPRLQHTDLPGKPALGVTLDRRHIVVVEDEVAVLEGLQVLLQGWGATVSAFDSVASVEAWAHSSGSSTATTIAQPDLVIVDYRLPEQRTGVDAIKVLRARFGPDLPAIMVTGSTMTGHEANAAEYNFHLLVKPVVPTKLRAMIAFKLGLRVG